MSTAIPCINSIVISSLVNLRELAPMYWKKILEEKILHNYPQFKSVKELESALFKGNWTETANMAVSPVKYRLFYADIPGKYDFAKISEIPDDTSIELYFNKTSKGKIFLSVNNRFVNAVKQPKTFLIVGRENNISIVMKFHPGQPIKIDLTKTKEMLKYLQFESINKSEALSLGFEWAKIIY